ncbi:metalloregulator ArsR/SmtB family transcription factor [Bartonella sp. HY329]|uniref:ArsR/SmtB family transcription factor n=1 Tax=unclassified Bartonella TaxID=2645622 RepID=UPI0021C5B681|nr:MULTISPECIES: metalloregulator ArsR/SmtB family transcription factor [unclassified Bartonella]UXM95692.1 metalloregulator ArsR/SmtB family transcription factor [Bartonella sp. HY329]UXN10017.1 metalloregulator ArsR/SmtB family transcription factor [Bartonella sp. HY328]
MSNLDLAAMVEMLKAASEATRLRILAVLCQGDLTVSDLTRILGQSQPRVSRHLKLLQEAGLIIRYQEGAWAYFRLADDQMRMTITHAILNHLNHSDHMLESDQHRLNQVKEERNSYAASYFSANAAEWDRLRLLHVPDNAVEAAMKNIVGSQSFQSMLDIGTGTGSMLKLFADLYVRGVGVDNNRDMLAIARSNLDLAGITNAQVRQGDIAALPVDKESFDLVTLHQVLHFLDDPQAAIREAARVMRPNARLVIVDFAAHDLEFLRTDYAHLRLGFSDIQMKTWIEKAGLELVETKEFEPMDRQKGLTVKLWLAKDPRLLIAARGSALTV